MGRYNNDSTYTRLGRIYHNMKTRCTNSNYDKYQYYGGKGIGICEEWMDSYDAFEEWALSHGYADDLTLDRIDVDKDYSPDNCRWVSWKDQANNRTSNHMLTHNGKTQTLQRWAEETGIDANTIGQRVRAGWDVGGALTEPIHKTHKEFYVTYNGKTQRLHEWAKELGISYKVLHNRIKYHHWPIEKAFQPLNTRWSYD